MRTKLWIDPGHGLETGARHPADVPVYVEDDLTWRLADDMARLLPNAGLSRHQQERPSLSLRAARAAQFQATHAIILHFNIPKGQQSEIWHLDGSDWMKGNWNGLGPLTGRPTVPKNAATDSNKRPWNCIRPYKNRGIDAVLVEVAYLDDQEAMSKCMSNWESVVDVLVRWCKETVK